MGHKWSEPDIKAIGDRYLSVVDFPNTKGVWLRFFSMQYTEWFSAAKSGYGSLAKAKKAAKIKRNKMLREGQVNISRNHKRHYRKQEDKLPPTATRTDPALVGLCEMIDIAEKGGITTTLQLKGLLKAAILEGHSVVDMNSGNYGDKGYANLNSVFATLSEGKANGSQPGRKLIRRGKQGSAVNTGEGKSGEWLRTPILLTAKGLKLINKLTAAVGGDALKPFNEIKD